MTVAAAERMKGNGFAFRCWPVKVRMSLLNRVGGEICVVAECTSPALTFGRPDEKDAKLAYSACKSRSRSSTPGPPVCRDIINTDGGKADER